MDREPQQDLIQKIIERASSTVLGWILKEQCELSLTAALEIRFTGKNRTARELLEQGQIFNRLKEMARAVIGSDVEVIIRDFKVAGDLPLPLPLPSVDPDDKKVQVDSSRDTKFIIWNGLRFRSQTEIRIAAALDRRRVLFFPNCMGRLGLKDRENREADFLICYEGKWGILEVDGEPHHPPTRLVKEQERDRLFKTHGILLVEHFDAAECWENADGVVKKFLGLLRQVK